MPIDAAIAIIIFAFVPVAVKFTTANPFTIGLFRLVVATAMIGLVYRNKIEWRSLFLRGERKSVWKLIVIGMAFIGHWLTYTFSIKVSGPSICVLGMATYGVQLIFYGSLFLGYHVRAKNIICLLFILIGVSLVIPSWDFSNNTTLGLMLALISASFYAIIPIMLQKSHEFSQETRIFAQFGVAMIGYLFLIQQTEWESLASTDWWALVFLAVLGTFIAHSLWTRVTSRIPTTTSGVLYYLITPAAMLLSHFLIGEELSLKQQIGGLIILVAALLNTLKLHGKNV